MSFKSYLTEEFDPNTGRPTGRQIQLPLPAPPEPEQRHWLPAALSSGTDLLQSNIGAFGGAIGRAAGWDWLANTGEQYAREQAAEAAANGRPDIKAPWEEGGTISGFPKYAAYTVAQQIPNMAAALGGGALIAGALPASVAAGAGGALSLLPRIAGGTGGMTAAAAANTGRFVAATTAAGTPIGAGSLYNSALDREEATGEKVTRGEAFAALAGGVPYAALEAIGYGPAVAGIKKLAAGSTDGIMKSAAKAMGAGVITESLTEATQTTMEMGFRPDLSFGEKSTNVVHAFLAGATVGGIMGGAGGAVGGMRNRSPRIDPQNTQTEDLAGNVDQLLQLPSPQTATTSPIYVDSRGQAGANLEQPQAGRQYEDQQRATAEAANQPPPEAAMPQLPGPTTYVDSAGRAAGAIPEIENYVQPADQPATETNEAGRQYAAEQRRAARELFANSGDNVLQTALNQAKKNGNKEAVAAIEIEQAERKAEKAALAEGQGITQAELDSVRTMAGKAADGLEATREAAKVDPFAGIPSKQIPKTLREAFETGGEEGLKAKLVERLEKGTDNVTVRTLASRRGINPDAKGTDTTTAPAPEEMRAAVPRNKANLGQSDTFVREVARAASDAKVGGMRDMAFIGETYDQYVKTTGDKISLDEFKEKLLAEQAAGNISLGAGNYAGRDNAVLQEQGRSLARRGYEDFSVIDVSASSKSPQIAPPTTAQAPVIPVAEAPVSATPAFVGPEADTIASSSPNWAKNIAALNALSEAQLERVLDSSQPATILKRIIDKGVKPTKFAEDMAKKLGLPSAQDFQTLGTPGSAQKVAVKQAVAPRRKPAARTETRPGLPEVTKVAGNKEILGPAPVTTLNETIASLPTPEARAEVEAAKQQGFEAVKAALGKHGVSFRLTDRDDEALDRGNGFNARTVQWMVDEITANGRELPLIEVIDLRDISNPNAVEINRLFPGRTPGFYSDGDGLKPVITIVANRHASREQVAATLYHELLGHFGLSRAFGQSYVDLMQKIHDTTPWVRAAIKADPRSKYYAKKPLWLQTEEWLSRQLEAGPIRASLFNHLVKMVRDMVRGTGLNLRYTRGEIKAILDRASVAGLNPAGRVISRDVGWDRFPKTETPQDPQLQSGMFTRTIPQINADTRKIVSQITPKILTAHKNPAVRDAARKYELYWTTINHIEERYGKSFKSGGLRLYKAAQEVRATLEVRMAQVALRSYDGYAALDKTAQKLTGDLMTLTRYNLDPRKSWAENAHALSGNDPAYDAAVERHWKMGHDAYNTLKRKGQHKVYEGFIATNETLHYAPQAASLYQMVQTGTEASAELKAAISDPVAAYLKNSSLHEDPAKTRDFWKNQTDKIGKQVADYLKSQGVQDSSKTSALNARLNSIRIEQAAMAQAPYFHVPRFGKHVVTFHMNMIDGKVDPKATEAIAKLFEARGIKSVMIARDSRKPNVFIRAETSAEQDQIYAVAKELANQGHIKADTLQAIERENEIEGKQTPSEWLTRMVEQIEAGFASKEELDAMDEKTRTATEAAQKEMLDNVRRYAVDLLPDTAYSKVMVQRENITGNSDDFVRGFAFRAAVGSRALAGMYGAQRVNDAKTSMRTDLKAAQRGEPAKVREMSAVLAEVNLREAQRPMVQKQTWVDTVRAINHGYFLGMSPSYVLVNLTQIPVLLMPELAKQQGVGFARASSAIISTLPMAWKITQAAIQSGWAVSAKRSTDAIITEEVLKKAGVDAKTITYLMGIVNSGKIDIGGASREQGRIVENRADSKLDNTLRWAAMFGYYSETFTRLTAALAANKLGLADKADSIIDQSMLQYSTWNTGRALGKMGVAGEITPLVTAFHQYGYQVLEKLFREFHTAIAGETDSKAEARRFIGYHMGAMLTVAGTLGLPFAAVIARAIDGLKDLLDDDDEPYNVQAAYRNMLADLIGKDAAEMFARGITRGIGIDISERAGEQNLLPFTKLLVDRREWNDASRDWAQSLLGSPAGMGLNILKGFEKISKGDVLGGMTEAMPSAFKGPAKAYTMSEKGYTDAKGNKLPISTPRIDELIAQATGFNTSRRAEYTEGRMTRDVRQGILSREAQNIRKQLAGAIESQDRDEAREWIGKAREFDRTNPAYAVLPTIGQTVSRRAVERDRAKATGTPLGTRDKDLSRVRDLTSFANYQ